MTHIPSSRRLAAAPTPAADVATRRDLRKVTLVAWAWVFACFTVWNLASPLWSTPDAQAHDLMAYHAVRDLTIERTDVYAYGVTSNAITDVPRGLAASARSYTCYAYRTTAADCLRPVTDDEVLVPSVNPAGRNMPTYYVATGWPSLLVPVTAAVPADRLAAGALAALMVAWAWGAAMTRRRRWVAATGLVLASTPMVMYLGGAVNPNSLEITAAMAAAACGVVFLQEGGDTWLGQVMLRRSMIAITMMVTIRMLAPVWVLAWVAAFAVLATRKNWSSLLSRRTLPWVSLPVVGTLFDVVWTLTSGVTQMQAEPRYDNSVWTNLGLSAQQINSITLPQQVGVLGWLDTHLPLDLYQEVLVVAFLACLVAVVRLGRREALAVGLLLALQYLLPVVLQALQYNTNGPVWQGRYTLPLTVMVPIVLFMYAAPRWRPAEGAALSSHLDAIYPLVWLVLAVTQLRALLVLLRRNVSGFDGPTILSGPWQPPLGALTLIVGQAALLLVALAALLRLYRADRRQPDTSAVDEDPATPRQAVPAQTTDSGSNLIPVGPIWISVSISGQTPQS